MSRRQAEVPKFLTSDFKSYKGNVKSLEIKVSDNVSYYKQLIKHLSPTLETLVVADCGDEYQTEFINLMDPKVIKSIVIKLYDNDNLQVSVRYFTKLTSLKVKTIDNQIQVGVLYSMLTFLPDLLVLEIDTQVSLNNLNLLSLNKLRSLTLSS